jgi:hypothetical protein
MPSYLHDKVISDDDDEARFVPGQQGARLLEYVTNFNCRIHKKNILAVVTKPATSV